MVLHFLSFCNVAIGGHWWFNLDEITWQEALFAYQIGQNKPNYLKSVQFMCKICLCFRYKEFEMLLSNYGTVYTPFLNPH